MLSLGKMRTALRHLHHVLVGVVVVVEENNIPQTRQLRLRSGLFARQLVIIFVAVIVGILPLVVPGEEQTSSKRLRNPNARHFRYFVPNHAGFSVLILARGGECEGVRAVCSPL